MTFVSCGSRRHAAMVMAAFAISLLMGRPVFAQPQSHGVQAWQAERAIKDFAKVFAAQHLPTNDYSKVRVKISNVRRVYNQQIGWIVVAIFEGAVVPDVYKPTQTQTYYHGILKIVADKKGVVQPVVVNEGQGLTKMTTRTALLRDELPKSLGGWANWGGNPKDIAAPSNKTAPTATAPTSQTPSVQGTQGSHGTSSAIDREITNLANQMKAAQAQCKKTGDPKDCARFYALQKAYLAKVAEKAKAKP